MLRAGDHVRVDVREADVSPRTSVVDLCRVTEVLVPRVVPCSTRAGYLERRSRRWACRRTAQRDTSSSPRSVAARRRFRRGRRPEWGASRSQPCPAPTPRDSHPAAVDVVAVVVAEVTSHTLRRVALRTFTWISAGSHTTHVRKRNRRDVRHVCPARASTRAAACGDQRRDDDESCHNSIHQLTYLSNMILTHVC